MSAKNKISEPRSDRIIIYIFYAFVAIYSCICLYPLILAFSVAFSSENAIAQNGYSIFPQDPTLDTFRFILSQKSSLILQAYGTTILVTAVGTFVSLAITLMYAFVISMSNFKHKSFFTFFAYFTMLFSGGMLPWYILCTQYYHLTNKFVGLFLPYGMQVFNMFLMRNYLKTIPETVYEAARIDGAGYGTIFLRISLPLSQVGLVTIGLFYGLTYWNDFYLPLMLISDDSLTTLQYLLQQMMGNLQFLLTNSSSSLASQISPPMQTAKMAMSVLAIGPIILLYPMVQKYFVKGVIVGAIKG